MKVLIDFDQIGTAGPFPVVDGRVRLPAETMMDLARMLKPTIDAMAAAPQAVQAAVPLGWIDENTLRAMQDTPKSEKTRWPIYNLSEYASKEGMIPVYSAAPAHPSEGVPTQTDHATELAPPNSLPTFDECALRVENSNFLEKRAAGGGYGPEHDSKTATQLHRFIYEYDDADPVRSSWFLHRLELLLNEVRSATQPAPAIFGDEDHVLVPRGLIGAACYAIDKKRDGTKTLAELRRYTTGDLSAATQPAAQGMDAQAWPDFEALRHSANEWADMATSGLQWLRNIVDGISDPKQALANLESNLTHCRAVNDDPAAQRAIKAIAAALAAQAKQGGA